MHRIRITATLLVGIAVTAVSGCVSVEPSKRTVAPRSGAGRPVQDVAPQIVQPPVRDSLEALPGPVTSVRAVSPGAPSPARRTAPRAPRQYEPAGTPGVRTPRRVSAVPPAALPAVPGSVVTGSDVCRLGRGYGRWPAGSPQSLICDETYGR
ncbi:hypothetical protein OG257_32720 [Streptomyces sp. NBC_00683]